MQQRFCSCGYPIWVQYLLPNKYCWVIFRPEKTETGQNLHICPNCLERLSIDKLR